jgi:hypothetical protein
VPRVGDGVTCLIGEFELASSLYSDDSDFRNQKCGFC